MKKLSLTFLLSGLLAVAFASGQAVNAADAKTTKTAEPTTETAKPKRDWYPFHGIVSAVDKQAKTISLKKKDGDRVLKIDAKSDLEVAGKPVAIADIKIGTYAHGKLHKDASGAEFITAAKFDTAPPAKAAGDNVTDKKHPDTGASTTGSGDTTGTTGKKKQ